MKNKLSNFLIVQPPAAQLQYSKNQSTVIVQGALAQIMLASSYNPFR
ncbi:MAG: hypothetical protein WC868_09670 [Bacteroidales bacterium]